MNNYRGEQEWCNGESTRHPPMWPGFKSRRLPVLYGLSLSLVLSHTPRNFSPGTPVFLHPQNQYFRIPIRSGTHGHDTFLKTPKCVVGKPITTFLLGASESNRDLYADAIEALPLSNTPDVFGLHPNAEIGYYTHSAKDMWSHLVELQPQTGGESGGVSREEFIGKIATDIQGKLPPLFDVDRVRKSITEITPTYVVLLQELDRFNVLIRKMSTSLINLQRVSCRETRTFYHVFLTLPSPTFSYRPPPDDITAAILVV